MRKHNKRFAAVMALVLSLTMVFSSVSVNAATAKVKSMTLKAAKTTLEINDTTKVTVKVKPAKASAKVTWKSSNKKVATVSTTGVVTAKKEGKVTITATSKSNKKVKKSVKITVKPFEQHYVSAETVCKAVGSKVIILDVRDDAKYVASHVPGSVAASVTDGDTKAIYDNVVKTYGKTATYYLVCNSGNSLADKATEELKNRGVATSKIFTLGGDDATKSPDGGWKAWQKNYPDFVTTKGTTKAGFEFNQIVTVENLKKDMDGAKKYAVIDVRDADTYGNGHIPGAISAPVAGEGKAMLSDAEAKANIKKAVAANPGKLYAVCCYSGNNFVNRAREVFNLLGYDENKLVCISGGYAEYSKVFGLDGVDATYNYVSAKQVKEAGSDVVILDVRSNENFAKGHVPGSVAASVVDGDTAKIFDGVVAKYGKDAKYYIVCNSGNSLAVKGTKQLTSRGVSYKNVFTLGGDDAKQSPEGGWKAWSKAYPNDIEK